MADTPNYNTRIDTDHLPPMEPGPLTQSVNTRQFSSIVPKVFTTRVDTNHIPSVASLELQKPDAVVAANPVSDAGVQASASRVVPSATPVSGTDTQAAQFGETRPTPKQAAAAPDASQSPATNETKPPSPTNPYSPTKVQEASRSLLLNFFSGRIGRKPGTSLTSRLLHGIGARVFSDYDQVAEKATPAPVATPPVVPTAPVEKAAETQTKQATVAKKADPKATAALNATAA